MKYIKYFEDIETVPGFEGGTIDPDDDEIWSESKISDKDRYKDFLKITKERNFQETEDEIIINIDRLWKDFNMSIYDASKHFKEFILKELINKYISKGFWDLMTEEKYSGYIEDIGFLFDNNNCFIVFKLEGQPRRKHGFCDEIITIDKLKTNAKKYNL